MTSLVVENLDALLALGCTALVISNNIMAIQTMMILNSVESAPTMILI